MLWRPPSVKFLGRWEDMIAGPSEILVIADKQVGRIDCIGFIKSSRAR